jgi:hypothetical protein
LVIHQVTNSPIACVEFEEDVMTSITRTVLALAFTAAWAVPAAPQSANRTGAGTPKPAANDVAVITEDPAVRNCRLHCGALAATAPHSVFPHQTVADRDARGTACSRKMIPR